MIVSPPSLSQTLPEKLAMKLAERIVAGEYEPGERLVEAVIVKEFGVSHGPVRDALKVLQAAGLVTIHPYRGAQVTMLSVRDVQEIYQVRAALVGLRARWIAEDPARNDLIAQVETTIARLVELAETDKRGEEYIALAHRINQVFTDGVSNRWLRSMLEGLTLQTIRYTRLALATRERRRESARLWKQLLNAIRAGNGERAENIASVISLGTRDAAIKHLNQKEHRKSA